MNREQLTAFEAYGLRQIRLTFFSPSLVSTMAIAYATTAIITVATVITRMPS